MAQNTDPEVRKSEIAQREEEVLAFWQDHTIFKKSVEKDAPNGEYVFHDGPPFATGTPHYGHLVGSAMKDAVPRYWTMKGYRVDRQWGWDCHGLPIENIVEKELGTKSKKDIEEMGVKKFNDACRKQIFTYVDIWNKFIPRFGRWADMEHPYKTMDTTYMESEWWAFKTLYEKGLIYEDYRSMHICPRCETTLSQSEVTEGYKDVKDLTVTAKFKVKNPEKIGLNGDVYILAWTTTPWTLPGNVALAVGEDIEYVAVLEEGGVYIKAKNIEIKKEGHGQPFWKPFKNGEPTIKGVNLVGLEYEPLFDYYAKDEALKNRENGWKVVTADFVTTESGTGVVHIAPAFGADDMALGKEKNLPFVQHVGMDGRFKLEVTDFAGKHVKPKDDVQATDVEIIKYLAAKGLLFAKEKIEHSYPHCWRCDTPLLNYATSSWFVAVEKIKPELMENAQVINWSPAHIKEGRFGKWLEGARDWSISRQRFWANTIPVWRCDKCKKDQVFGSIAELEKASGATVEDLHKDVVDEITVPCPCGGVATRVPDVLDTWFDSGSVPFASLHYPFEHEAEFKKRVPADFIAEGQDQCRAWFYYQHVLAGGLFHKNAFKNVIVNGIVLAEDGKKMSKRLKNYPDPDELINKYGADAARLYMLSSPVVRAENLNFSEKGVDEWAKKVLMRLQNVYAFYALYADSVSHEASDTSDNVLDRWIIARTHELVRDVTKTMDAYDLDGSVRPFMNFVDDLSVWYIRRCRDRFKGDDLADTAAALSTTRFVLRTYAQAIAPFAPFSADWIWRALRTEGDAESVHLSTWPTFDEAKIDLAILAGMQEVRRTVTLALDARTKAGLKVRQPLGKLTIPQVVYDQLPDSDALLSIIADEVNIKEVVPSEAVEPGTVVLDTDITPELKEEGVLREFIRAVQDLRKKKGLKQGEQVLLRVSGDASVHDIIKKFDTAITKIASLTDIEYGATIENGEEVALGEGKIVVQLQ